MKIKGEGNLRSDNKLKRNNYDDDDRTALWTKFRRVALVLPRFWRHSEVRQYTTMSPRLLYEGQVAVITGAGGGT